MAYLCLLQTLEYLTIVHICLVFDSSTFFEVRTASKLYSFKYVRYCCRMKQRSASEAGYWYRSVAAAVIQFSVLVNFIISESYSVTVLRPFNYIVLPTIRKESKGLRAPTGIVPVKVISSLTYLEPLRKPEMDLVLQGLTRAPGGDSLL